MKTKQLPQGWKEKPFLECLEKEASNNKLKIPQKDFLEEGIYPIIDQGNNVVAGYTNDETKVYSEKLPVVVFGDHTRVFKFIKFPFAIGADGTKILVPIKELNPKFFYYMLRKLNLPSAGYSRHYKFLKEKSLVIPPLETQQKIVSILEKAEQLKEKRKKSIEVLDEYLKSVFSEMFLKKKFEIKKLSEICDTSSGGTPSRGKKEYWENGVIPWIKSGDLNKDQVLGVDEFITEEGLKNSSVKYIEPDTVLIAMYGATAGKTSISRIKATTNQAVCAIVPKTHNLNKLYLLYLLRAKHNQIVSLSFGGGQPNISQQVIRSLKIPLPPPPLQEQFASIVKHVEKLKENQKKNQEEI